MNSKELYLNIKLKLLPINQKYVNLQMKDNKLLEGYLNIKIEIII